MSKVEILVVDDDPTFCMMLKGFLEKKNYAVTAVYSSKEAILATEKADFDIILSDYRLPDIDGLELLKTIKAKKVFCPFVLMTNYADIKIAVKSIKQGAYEYLTKPINPDELLLLIKGAIENPDQKEIHQEYAKSTETKAKPSNTAFNYINGSSDIAENMLTMINLVAPTNMSVIIEGESGTGKEYAAKLLHFKSDRSQKPFVAIDCGALTNELAASELFGHEKGSFTGAINNKTGQFQHAEGGTLFLDEIGNLDYEIQVKLLRALQERKIKKLGGKDDISVNVRLIVATNEDLKKAVENGKFREDLYHRLNEFKIEVPALRNRSEDIMIFAQNFLEESNLNLNKNIKGFNEEVVQLFKSYEWPGNLRELKNMVKRSVLLESSDYISLKTIPSEISQSEQKKNIDLESVSDLKQFAEKSEKEIILNILSKSKNNKTKAAKLLNIDRKTLYNKLKAYNIDL